MVFVHKVNHLSGGKGFSMIVEGDNFRDDGAS
jgi:hypothetical protein